MSNFNYPYFNQSPYMNQPAQYPQGMYNPNPTFNAPQNVPSAPMDIIRVKGQSEAESLKIPPNSRCLVLDDDAPIVWLCQSDALGSRNAVTPFTITPYEPEPQIDMKTFEERLSQLERKVFDNAESNNTDAESKRKTSGKSTTGK